ncbi:MAG: hypothetical protein ABI700_15070, partial [Chloroflexota bacterium]
WDNEAKTIIRYIYDGRWTWEELDSARTAAAKLEANSTGLVNVIVDVQNSKLLPNGTITRARQVATTAPASHPKEGITVIVGAGPFVRSIYDVMHKVYPDIIHRRGLYLAKSLDEAHTIIDRETQTQTSMPS